jgi:hypothetical protein
MDYTEQEIAEAIELRRQLNGICHYKNFRENVYNYAFLEPKQVDTSFIEIDYYERFMLIDESELKSKEVLDKLRETYKIELRECEDSEMTEVIIITRRLEEQNEHDYRVGTQKKVAERENKLIELAKAALNNRLIKDYFNLQDLLKL